jgi:hypothetical protein
MLGSVAACQMLSSATPATPTVESTPTLEAIPSDTPVEAASKWEQVEVNGVMLGIQIPTGWRSRQTDEGLLIAQRFGTMQSGYEAYGMQIHLFVYSMDGYNLPTSSDANLAWAVLKQIIEEPYLIGNAEVSEPAGFEWDGHDAAYYLLNDGDANMSILLAVALNRPQRLVVCNFSSPATSATEIRRLLPEILSTLTINGTSMNISAINSLPNPLPFPDEDDSLTPEA